MRRCGFLDADDLRQRYGVMTSENSTSMDFFLFSFPVIFIHFVHRVDFGDIFPIFKK